MAIGAPVERYASFRSSQTGTTTLSPTGTIAVGKKLILLAQSAAGKVLTAVSDDAGNTWAVNATKANGTTDGASIASCTVTAQLTVSSVLTLTWSSSTSANAGVWLEEFSNVGAFDKTASATGTSTSLSSGATATLSQADELVVGLGRWNSGGSWTKGADYTDMPTPSLGAGGAEYKIVSATTAVTATGTISGSAVTWACIVATYKGTVETGSGSASGAGSASATGVATARGSGTASGTGSATATGYLVGPAQLVVEIAFTDDPVIGYRDTSLHDMPVGAWRMDETGGLTDQTAHGNNGTFTGGAPTLVAGALAHDTDQASSFDGARYGSVPDSPSLSPTAEVAIECWIKLSALPGSTKSAVEKGGAYSLAIDSAGHVLFSVTGSESTATATSSTALSTGLWYHVVGSYDGQVLAVYIDGAQDAATLASIAIVDTANALLIASGATGSLACALDEVAVFSQGLSQSQVAEHFVSNDVVEWGDLTWTDVSEDVRSVTTKRGRQYELARVETGTATIVLNDTERKYDPTNASSPYAPYLLPLRQVRVRVLMNGIYYPIFRGFIEGWPATPAGPEVATYELTASDFFEGLAATEVTASIPAAASGTAMAAVLDGAICPRAARSLDAGGYVCAAIELSGAKGNDPVQTLADGEGGIAFCDSSGRVVFHDANHRLTATRSTVKQATFVDSKSGAGDSMYAEPAPALTKDRILNSWAVTAGDSSTETARDDESIRLYRLRPGSKSTYLTPDAAAGVASVLVSRTARPLARLDDVPFKLAPDDPTSEWLALLQREISDLVEVKRTPAIGSAFDQQSWVEGIQWTFQRGGGATARLSVSPVFTSSYFTKVIATPGVRAYYRMNAPDPLRDRSAFGNDGTLLGALNAVAGMTTDGDEATQFNGTTQSGFVVGADEVAGAGEELSVSFFIKVPALPASTRDVVSKRGSFVIALDSTGHIVFTVKNGTTSGTVTSIATLSLNTAYHVACTFDKANIAILINGAPDNSAAYAGGMASSQMPVAIAKTYAVTAAPSVAATALGPGSDDGNRTTDIKCNKPAGTVAGDLLIAQLTPDSPNGATVTAIPPGWTEFHTDPYTKTYIYWKIAGSSEPATYHWTGSSIGYYNLGIARISGVDPLLTFTGDQREVSIPGGGTVCDPGAVLPSVSHNLVVAFFTAQHASTPATFTETAGGTEAWEQNTGTLATSTTIAMNHRQQTVAASIDVVGTANVSSQLYGFVIVLPGTGVDLLACTLDEVAIFNKGLTPAQVAAHYAAR